MSANGERYGSAALQRFYLVNMSMFNGNYSPVRTMHDTHENLPSLFASVIILSLGNCNCLKENVNSKAK
jgi:hypothetical protein